MSADPAAITATVENYIAYFSTNDREGYLSLFSDDAWVEDPVGTPRHEGIEAIGAFWDTSRELASEIELRLIKANVCGGEVAFLMEIRPTVGDQQMVLTAIDVMTFDDDARITTLRAYFDMSELRPVDD
ncbi:MAG: nuclear transport factor 2 family protein [Microthrixaceae bacterium]